MMPAELGLGDELAFGQDARTFEHVAQLADVAVPRAVGQHAFGAGVRPTSGLLKRCAKLADERRREIRNVLAPVAQRRQRRSRRHSAGSTDRRGSGRPPTSSRRSRLVAAISRTSTCRGSSEPTRCTSPFSSTRSSLACTLERQLADLVEEQRAAVGRLEQARPCDRWRR